MILKTVVIDTAYRFRIIFFHVCIYAFMCVCMFECNVCGQMCVHVLGGQRSLQFLLVETRSLLELTHLGSLVSQLPQGIPVSASKAWGGVGVQEGCHIRPNYTGAEITNSSHPHAYTQVLYPLSHLLL